MDTHISGALSSRPASRLSTTSSDVSFEEERWINRHFELVTPTTSPLSSHTQMYCSYSHRRDSAEEGDSSPLDPFPFPDVRFVSLPEQSLLSRLSSRPSLSLSVSSHPDELARIPSPYGDSRPVTPTSTYTVEVEREMTSLFHMSASPVARPSSPLRFAPRSVASSTNSLPMPERVTLSASVAPSPRDGQGQRLGDSRRTGGGVSDAPDVSIAIDFVAENLRTGRPTFTSRITASDHTRRSVSVRTDARAALDEVFPAPLSQLEDDPSNVTLPGNLAGRATLSRTTSLSRKLGSFVARRLSVNRGRRHSASAGSPALARPVPLNHIVSGSSVSYGLPSSRPSIGQMDPTSPSSDASSNGKTRRYTLVLEVDVDVLENGAAATQTPARPSSLAVPKSPSPRTSFETSSSPSPNDRTSFDVELASPSRYSCSSHSPRVSFSPMPSSALAPHRPSFAAEMQAARPSHDQQLSHQSDGRHTLSPLPTSRPISAFDLSEPTMTVTIERDDAGPLTRLMRRMSIGRGRRRSATTSFVLASTRVLPVPEHTVEHVGVDGQSALEMSLNELDSNQMEMVALTPTGEQMRRWST
jgi:hypothetical protein